jgi:peptidase M48-like protein
VAGNYQTPLTFLKFSRGAEEEADRLGAQYMWAAGYDPHAMVTFFEKIEAKEKKKPGTIARTFSTHPMTSDRIKEVGNLVARFPDKQEYEISSSEFDSVKSRLISINAARRPGDERNGRPTLKRRPASTSAGGSDEGGSDEQSSGRPTLKRGDSSGANDGSGQESGKTDRPTLKRRGDANPNPDHER